MNDNIRAFKEKMQGRHIMDKELMEINDKLSAYSRGEGPYPEDLANDEGSRNTITFVKKHIQGKRPGEYVTDDGDRGDTGL